MNTVLLNKIKQGLRITHGMLDDDIQADVEACLADLKLVGVVYADAEEDPLIFNAIKLWCRSLYTDDTAKAAEMAESHRRTRDLPCPTAYAPVIP
jgi:hypothetical protein